MNLCKTTLAGSLAAFTLFSLSSCQNQQQQENKKKELAEKEGNRPNIVLIMADDVAPFHFSHLSGDLPTPHFDKVAGNGMVFNRGYAASAACTPSRFGIMTGQFAGRCLDEEFLSENPLDQPYDISWNTPITKQNLTIQEVLNTAGYYTGFVGKYHIGELNFNNSDKNQRLPDIDLHIDVNTDKSDSLLAAFQQILVDKVKEMTGADFAASIQWENPEEMPAEAIRLHNLEWLTYGAERFFNSISDTTPFFLHFNTTALHGPNHYDNLQKDPHFTSEGRIKNPYKYHPPRESIFKRLDSMGIKHGDAIADYINHYNAGILYMDDQIGAIMKMLEEKHLLENTLVIITADHSIEPGKGTTYNRGVHVPFIAHWPAQITPGSATNQMVQLVDFLPTFAGLAKAKVPDNQKIDGVSFKPVLMGENVSDRKHLFFEEGHSRAVFDGQFKYIAYRFPDSVITALENQTLEGVTHFGEKMQAHAIIASEYHPAYFDVDQLYDLSKDPYEQNNLAQNPEYKDELERMKNALKKYTDSFRHPFPLDKNDFQNLPGYKKAAETAKAKGTDFIPWWDRTLDYPPQK